ncbi:MAG TPA: patatin-like phospholipase family protein [Myxococcales bacterium]|nr:patatin-like phospholipase family protein [Myxococcales bacterium]
MDLKKLTHAIANDVQKVIRPVEHAVQSAAREVVKVEQKVASAVDRLESGGAGAALRAVEKQLRPAISEERVRQGDDQSLFGGLKIDYGSILSKIDVEKVKKILKWVFPPHIHDPDGDKFKQQTQPFRDTLGQVRALRGELDALPPGDPRRPQVEAKLKEAAGKLEQASGYTEATAPKPGALWIDPQLQKKEIPGGQVNASLHPTRAPVLSPPDPMDALFGGGKSVRLVGDDGKVTEVRSPEEYRKIVAANRAGAGMPRTDGEPIAVHLSLEGGGGKGKRYGPAFSEMLEQGVVPASVSGTSVGSIAAGLIAAGADPQRVSEMVKDPALSKWFDIDLIPDDGGLSNGQVAYDTLDKWLRDVTGIHDRPVTFADLKMPCQIIAATYSDSNPPKGREDMTKPENRTFVFSQETTPDTPVALAIRASMAIPAVWDPVEMVDPTTGRSVHLTDGGVFDGLPMHYENNKLPVIGMHLYERDSNMPVGDNVKPGKPLPRDNQDSTHIIWNALNGWTMHQDSAADARDYQDRNAPRAGDFILGVPVWNLDDPNQEDDTFGLTYDDKVDPILDKQSRQVVRNFLKQELADLGKQGASGKNIPSEVPADLKFSVPVQSKGNRYTASYSGGDTVTFVGADGKKKDLKLGQTQIDAMWLDNLAFGDISAQLRKAFEDAK